MIKVNISFFQNGFNILHHLCRFSFAQQTETFVNKLEQAKKEHKKILLYFSGSDWCAPCIKFKKFIIQTEEFQAFAKTELIIYNADFPRQSKNKLAKEVEKENEALAGKSASLS